MSAALALVVSTAVGHLVAPLGALTVYDSLGPAAIAAGVVILGVLFIGIGIHLSRRRGR